MKRFLMTLVVVLAGCATQTSYVDRAENAIQNRDWEVAYKSLESGLASNIPEAKRDVLAIIAKYPEIRMAASNSFSTARLRNSIDMYGMGVTLDIESKRLQSYIQFASPEEYKIAKTNLDHILKEMSIEDAERNRLAQLSEEQRQKTVDEKRRADEADSVRQMESRLRTQRALEVASDQARFMCKDRIDCDKAFSLTQIYIVSNSDMKIQVANDTIIETYNATEGMNISMKAIKMPRAGSTAEIMLSVNCRDEGKEPYKDLCNSKSLSIYSGYPQFVQKNLIR